MKIFTSSRVKEIDAFTISNEPVSSIDLMERASGAFVGWILKHYDKSKQVKVFAGSGNNGGDALAITRLLLQKGYDVYAYLLNLSDRLSPDCEANYKRLISSFPGRLTELNSASRLPELHNDEIIIDGIFGSGITRPVTGYIAEVINHINRSKAFVVAIDMPSGLFGEDNTGNIQENIVKARYTFTFQFPFLSFFFAENYCYTGEIVILDIGLHPEAISTTPSMHFSIEPSDIKKLLRKREKYSHKGTYGHALLICGSYGMMGAAVLAAKACLRGGAGLVTAHVPRFGYEILQASVPEALVSIDESDIIFTDFPELSAFSAIGIGPGIALKNNSCKGLKRLLEDSKVPLVIDADALNILAENPEWFSILPRGTILTPHPGEFDRLTGRSESMYERYCKQLELAARYKINIILKGAHSILVTEAGETWFNTTGNPGMATGGSGDVLTGLLVSLLAQGYSSVDSALIGVYLHGLAGDIAVLETGEQSLIASDIINYLGKAFIRTSS